MNQNNFDWHSEIVEKAALETEKSLIDMKLPSKMFLPPEVKNLGSKIAKLYNKKYIAIKDEFEDSKFEEVVAFAYKQYWTACHRAAHYMRLIYIHEGYKSLNETPTQFRSVQDYKLLNETQKQIISAQGYADYEGWAYTFYNYASELKTIDSLKSTELKREMADSLLDIMGLYWLNLAEDCPHQNERFDLIAEAFDAFELTAGMYMWNGGQQSEREGRSQAMSAAAKIRHVETYELKKQAIDYWLANIDTKLSNDKAAELLMKVVALSHRKLSQYVAEAKRENIPPASTE